MSSVVVPGVGPMYSIVVSGVGPMSVLAGVMSHVIF